MNGAYTGPAQQAQQQDAASELAQHQPDPYAPADGTVEGSQRHGSGAGGGSEPRPPLAGPLPASLQQQQQQQGGASLPRPASASSDIEQPFTFTSPSSAAAELQRGRPSDGGIATDGRDVEADGGGDSSRRPSGVLRSSFGDPNRLRRNVSWTDLEHQAPLAQVVEYEPSDRHSSRSDDDWDSPPSGCLCCLQ
jgi:hypothetical protein